MGQTEKRICDVLLRGGRLWIAVEQGANGHIDIIHGQSHTMAMETISAAKFKEQCLALMDSVGPEGIVITKRGKPVAKLVAIPAMTNHAHLIGIAEGQVGAATDDDLLSTGAWNSDEWGNLNAPA